MAELMWVKWYATVLRQNLFAAEVAKAAPIALRYGATQYQVHVDGDDRYKITQMTWVPDHPTWYAYWEGPEMIEFRARWLGKYQIPIVYAWATEIASGLATPESHAAVASDDAGPVAAPAGQSEPLPSSQTAV
jgi:hypothetical protein